jgi:hypothetical protein
MTYQLEEPFLEEKGKITSQKEIGGNRMQVTYLSDGIMKGTIKVTNEGNFVSISKGGNATSAQGQGVITTKDGTEKASYNFLQVGKVIKDGKPIFYGAAVWSTDSKDKLAFLENMLSFFKGELDEAGNFTSKDRELK